MKRLLIFDYFRGVHSTGFASLHKHDDEGTIVKLASHPVDLFDSKRFDKALSAWNSSVFLGHNRHATAGKVNGVNAHPFQSGDIIGAHNGTLTSESWQDLEEELGYQTGTDSEAIIKCIDKIGIEETVKKLQGAWALVWFDCKKQELYFLRNKERPFWLAHTENFEKVVWASEWPMISAALNLDKKGYDLHTEKNDAAYFATKENVLYTFPLADMAEGLINDRREYEGITLKGREAPKKVVSTGGPFPGGTNGGTDTTTSTTTSLSSIKPLRSLELDGTVSDPFDGLLIREKFEEIAHGGCDWCGGELDFYEQGNVVYLNRDKVIGPRCSGTHMNELHVKGPIEKFLHDNTKLKEKV